VGQATPEAKTAAAGKGAMNLPRIKTATDAHESRTGQASTGRDRRKAAKEKASLTDNGSR